MVLLAVNAMGAVDTTQLLPSAHCLGKEERQRHNPSITTLFSTHSRYISTLMVEPTTPVLLWLPLGSLHATFLLSLSKERIYSATIVCGYHNALLGEDLNLLAI